MASLDLNRIEIFDVLPLLYNLWAATNLTNKDYDDELPFSTHQRIILDQQNSNSSKMNRRPIPMSIGPTGPSLNPLQKLFDIDKVMIQQQNHGGGGGVQNSYLNSPLNPPQPPAPTPYSTRSHPDILIFDNPNLDLSSFSSPSPSDSILSSSSSSQPSLNIFSSNDSIFEESSPKVTPISSLSPTFFSVSTTTTMLPPEVHGEDGINKNCNSSLWFNFGPGCFSSPEDYELITAMLCSSLVVLGVVYLTYGYRCFRAFSFFVGVVFGAIIFHTICTAENIVILQSSVPYGNLIASLLTGLAVGSFTMLVIYVGLFVIGIHLGLMMATIMLIVIYLLRPYYIVLQAPLSALTLLIFFVALSLVGALTTVYFSKGCTILASSMYGSALTLLCADYFVENFKVVHWFLDQLSKESDWYGLLKNIKRGQQLCSGSHIILMLWPILTIFGLLVQALCTARHFKYRGGYGIVRSNDNGASAMVNHHHQSFLRDRSHHHHNNLNHHNSNIRSTDLEEARLEQKHRKYRYLYQVRTAHGDVISQHYLQSLQNKTSNKKQLCLPDQDSFTFNSDLSSHFPPSESRTTTLSVA